MNQVVLDGQVVERRALRYTPAGIPALDFVIAHESVLVTGQRISLQMAAVAFEATAQILSEAGLASDKWVFEGHLIAKPSRPGVSSKVSRLQVQTARRVA